MAIGGSPILPFPKDCPHSHKCHSPPSARPVLSLHPLLLKQPWHQLEPMGKQEKKWEQQALERVSKHGLFGDCLLFLV